MRILLLPILILSLLCGTGFVAIEATFGQEWGSPVSSPARLEPLPDIAYASEASRGDGTSLDAASYRWEPRYGLATPSQTGSLVSAASYEEEPIESSGSPGLGGWTFGYDGGFLIASPSGLKTDTDDSDFLIRIGTWGQLRHAASDFQGPNPDLNQFEFERLRLSFKGHAFCPEFQYFMQFDSDSDEGEDTGILDYYVTYDIGHHLWGCPRKRLEVRGGKWKVPFTRFRVPSPTHLEFTDFAMAGMLFDLNRGLGVGLLGERDLCARQFTWQVALANGLNVSGFRTDRSHQLDNNLVFSGRVTWLLAGDDGKDGEPDLDFRECPAWRVGAAIAGSHVNREGLREFSRMRVVDSGQSISNVLPDAVTDYDIFLATVDSHLKYRGFSFITDYYFRSLSEFAGAAVPDLYDHGFLVQMGYFLVPKRFELITRWSRVVGDSGTLSLVDQSADEVAGGAVWYIRGHNLKTTFDVTHVNGSPVSSSTLNLLPGDDGWLFRTQFQWRF